MVKMYYNQVGYSKKAKFNYTLLDSFEAGIVLTGSEVKSVRNNGLNLIESFVTVKNNEIFINNLYIDEYSFSNQFSHNASRPRKLLLNKREINKLRKVKEVIGQTIVPYRAYFKGNYLKIEIYTAQGKKNYDKRNAEKERDIKRILQKNIRR
jgi:SsrA-binding protein